MPAAYPIQLRSILRASKSRTQPAAFSLSEPRRGFAYAKPTGTDTPVFWDVAFRFTADEAVVFQLWFRNTIKRGAEPFTMPIRTEFGVLDHVCLFLPDGLLPASEAGDTWGYTATIMARAQVIPAGYDEASDLIIGLPDWTDWGSILDEAMSREMPTA
jgi:hypothetical protein